MVSRCNFYSIAMTNARLNAFGHRRLFVPCTGCLLKRTTSVSGQKKQQSLRSFGCITTDVRSFTLYTSDRRRTMSTTTNPLPTTTNPLPTTTNPPPPSDEKPPNIFQRFKNMAKKYWYIVLPVHLVTSTVWFGSFYLIASIFDVPVLLERLGIPDSIIDKVRNGNSWTSYLVIAYGLYKIFTPLRYMVTLGGTGITLRYLRRLGYVIDGKPPPKKP